jgi:hypothetical protein
MWRIMVLVCCGWAGAAFPSDSLVPGAMVEIKEQIPVFETSQRRMYEKPVYTLEKGEWVELGEAAGDMIRLNFKGRAGWVEKSRLEFRTGGSQYIKMEEMEIKGWLDNPQAIYILDAADSLGGLRIERSFIYDDPSCMENIVKAEFEMENELYYFKPIH